MASNSSDESGFRDRDLEMGLFVTFGIFGVFGTVLIPPTKKIKIMCCCYWNFPSSIKRALAIYLVYLVNIWFVCAYVMMALFFEIQFRIWDLHLYGASFYWFCLGIGGIFALFSIMGFTRVWLVVFHVLIVNLIATMIYPCSSSSCFYIRGMIVIACVATLSAIVACCVISDKIAEMLTVQQTAMVGPFCAVFALANAALGLEYWFDEENPWYLLVIALVIAVVKQIGVAVARRLVCCTHWTELIDEEIVTLGGDGYDSI